MATKEEILNGYFATDHPEAILEAMQSYATQEVAEWKAAAEKNLEQVLHLGTLATDLQAALEGKEKEIELLSEQRQHWADTAIKRQEIIEAKDKEIVRLKDEIFNLKG